MLIELAYAVGLNPKKVSFAEFHSPCPNCNGKDRFIIQPKKNRYKCRQCKKSGDAIQFCRDFMGMSFQEARERVGDEGAYLPPQMPNKPSSVFSPSKSWETKATEFIKSCHQRLLIDPTALQNMKERGLSMETIQKYLIGLNPVTTFPSREDWGLQRVVEDGKEKKLCLPAGFTIPAFEDQLPRKIKIRRSERQGGDKFGKYYILPGSADLMPIFGDSLMPVVVVVEAEFDAMLVVQDAGEHCCCIALGGAQKRPDAAIHWWLQERKLIVFALDFDEAGKNEYSYWRSAYPNLCPWPVPTGKSPGDAWRLGVDLKKWILSGLQHLLKS
jgi:DNA primase